MLSEALTLRKLYQTAMHRNLARLKHLTKQMYNLKALISLQAFKMQLKYSKHVFLNSELFFL